MRKTFTLERLSGIFGEKNKEKRIAELKKRVRRSEQIVQIVSNENWPAMKEIFASFRDEAVKGLSAPNVTIEDVGRLTGRMALLKEIPLRIQSIIRAGKEAQEKLDKLMESPNG